MQEPVVVFASSRADLVAIAKSILLSSEIDFWVRGEGVQDLFGYGRFPAGSNVFIGPIELLVKAEDASDAQELLAGLTSPAPSAHDSSGADGDTSLQSRSWWSVARPAARVVVIVMLTAIVLEALAAWIANPVDW